MRKSLHSIFIVLVLGWSSIFSPAVLAAPNVTGAAGTFVHKSQITISGSGFGSKSPARPYVWAPFDGSSAPSALGIVSVWHRLQQLGYDPTCGVTGEGCLAGTASDGVNTNAWVACVTSPAEFDWNSYGQRTYVYRRSRRDFAYDSTKNVKNFRWWGMRGDGALQYPNFYFGSSNGRIGIEGTPHPYNDYTMSASNLAQARGPVGEWYTEEMVFKSNTNTDTADADFRLMVNGGPELVSFPNTSWIENRIQIRSDSGYSNDGRMRILCAVHMVVEGSDGWIPTAAGSRYWADDVYVDTTWARVMVGDAPTLEGSTRREIQIPSAWSDSSITATVNRGSFACADAAYLYVVDADGNANANGLPVTLCAGDALAPAAPTNLTVQ